MYDGCNVSRKESEMLLMALALRHNFTDVALENTMHTIDCHLPQVEYRSKYRFLQNFPTAKIIEYYYCADCHTILTFDEKENAICNGCQKHYKKGKLKSDGQFFINVPLKEQLEELLNSKEYLNLRQKCSESDVVNGFVYKQFVEQNVIGENDISIQWNVDGVSLYNSSKISMWPILVTINELKYRTRKNNVMLCGIWYGAKKPCMNLFLKPFITELLDLRNEGINCTTFTNKGKINVKIHTLLCIVDSVARPMVQNMMQFNAHYGCPYCEHRGEQVSVGRGTARIYAFNVMCLRSSVQHSVYVHQAVDIGKAVMGVKGPSVVSLLSDFNIIESVPPDYMHSCLLGVSKLFVTAWFDSKHNSEEYYIGLREKEFNERLLSIQPPTEITRTPRPVTDKYKANEWKNFVLYYSIPCLKGIMKTKYIKHWHLFVFGLYLLLKESISDSDVQLAKTAFEKFVLNIQNLYGKEFLKFNVHLLLHIPRFVKNYGALWAWSAFPFENFNGVIKKVFHGTQYVPQQVVKNFTRLRYVKNNSSIFDNENCNKRTVDLFVKLMNQCNVKHCIEYSNELKIFGKPKTKILSLTEKVLIEQLLVRTVEESSEWYYRFIHKKVLFHSCNYKRLKKRNNSCALISDGSILSIIGLIKVTTITPSGTESKYVIMGRKTIILNEKLCKYKNFDSNVYSYIVSETSNIACYEVSSITAKCVVVPYQLEKNAFILL